MAADVELRDALPDDVPELVGFLIKLDAHVAGVDPELLSLTEAGEEQLRDRMESFIQEPGKRLVVAVGEDGRLVGMGDIHIWHYSDTWLNPERRGLRSGFIDDLWIEPDHRGGGLAKRIVAELLDFAAREDIQEVALEYALHNPEAGAFWRRLGFQPTGVRASARLSDLRTRLRPEAQRKAEEET